MLHVACLSSALRGEGSDPTGSAGGRGRIWRGAGAADQPWQGEVGLVEADVASYCIPCVLVCLGEPARVRVRLPCSFDAVFDTIT